MFRLKLSHLQAYINNCVTRGAQESLLVTQYCAYGKIEKNEMGGACGVYGGGERCAQGSSGETGGKETKGET